MKYYYLTQVEDMAKAEEDYRSTLLIPISALQRFKERARRLRIEHLPLARGILVTALEGGTLPEEYEIPDSSEPKSQFPFVIDGALVEELGGKDRARELMRWAIVEGLDASPFSPP